VRTLADEGAAVLLVTHNVVEAERAVDRLAILDHGVVMETGTPAQLKERVANDLRLELVLEPGVEPPAMPEFVMHTLNAGQRSVAAVHATAAAQAVGWAEGLKHAGTVEEYRLGPATLEDVYVELVGRADALANGGGQAADATAPEVTRVRAA
jgi:ABC-2 type transport system ATP-binding protein